MQDSSAFHYIAIDQIRESTTNPRQTFEQAKLEELAEFIRQHGLIHPSPSVPPPAASKSWPGQGVSARRSLPNCFHSPPASWNWTTPQRRSGNWRELAACRCASLRGGAGFPRLLDLPGYDVAAQATSTPASPCCNSSRMSPRHSWRSVSPPAMPTSSPVCRRNIRQTPSKTAGAKIGRTRRRICFRPSTFRHGFRRIST
jgi:ParB family chromosome partitioning protein